ncbi:MAG: hypothetical protein K8R99_00680 [Actinomycetia bacterium]|nr:hypothetical protein [Actinomycetes bacterium]
MTTEAGKDNQIEAVEPEDFGLPEREAPPPEVGKKFDPDESREKLRSKLAIGVLVLLVYVVGVPIWQVSVSGRPWKDVEGIMGATFPGVVGIAGTILGFYFGSKESK